jgi:hypothetical protein
MAEAMLAAMQAEMLRMQNDMQVMRAAMTQQDQMRAAETVAYAAEVRRISDERFVDQGRMQAVHEQLVAARARPTGPPATLIDTKGIGKPKSFSGKSEDWKEFSFKYLNFAGSAFPMVKRLTTWAEEQVGTIVDYADADIISIDAEHISLQVFLSLGQIVEGEALDILRNVPDDNGLEGWRRLCRRFDPQTVSRRRSAITKIINPPKATLAGLGSAIEKWDEMTRAHERRTGRPIDDDVKASVLTEMCPDKLGEHIALNQSRLVTYQQVRDEIAMYLEQVNAKAITSRSSRDDMDVSSLGKGKGDKGKGKGKDSGKNSQKEDRECWKCGKKGHLSSACWSTETKGEGKGKAQPKAAAFEGYCSSCWKWGHKAADCRGAAKAANPKAKAKGKGKGKAKGKGLHAVEEGYTEPEEETWEGSALGVLDLCSVQTAEAWEGAAPGVRNLCSPCSVQTEYFNIACDDDDEIIESFLGECGEISMDGGLNGLDDGDEYEIIEATIDSGAAVSIMPEGTCCSYPIEDTVESLKGVWYSAAGGQQIADQGSRRLQLQQDDGSTVVATVKVGKVRKVLLSVAKIVAKGHTVVFSSSQPSCIYHDATGRCQMLREKAGVFVLDMKVKKYNETSPASGSQLAAVQIKRNTTAPIGGGAPAPIGGGAPAPIAPFKAEPSRAEPTTPAVQQTPSLFQRPANWL